MRKIPVLQVIVFLVGVKIYSLLGPENVVKPFFRESDRCSRLRATRQKGLVALCLEHLDACKLIMRNCLLFLSYGARLRLGAKRGNGIGCSLQYSEDLYQKMEAECVMYEDTLNKSLPWRLSILTR